MSEKYFRTAAAAAEYGLCVTGDREVPAGSSPKEDWMRGAGRKQFDKFMQIKGCVEGSHPLPFLPDSSPFF